MSSRAGVAVPAEDISEPSSQRTIQAHDQSATASSMASGASKVINDAFEAKRYKFWLNAPRGYRRQGTLGTKKLDTLDFETVISAPIITLLALSDDFDAWSELYGPVLAAVLAIFGRKSVWKMQANLLGSPGAPGGSPSSPGELGPPPGGPGDPCDPCCPGDSAADEYKTTIETESNRITVSGTLIAQIVIIALTLPSLSQTHWVARASWVFSLIASIFAVYYANLQARNTAYLLLGSTLRSWIRGHVDGPEDVLRYQVQTAGSTGEGIDPDHHDRNFASLLVRSITPAPSSVLIVSAPGSLLSASLYFLLIGFGIYFGFVWTRNLDDLAGLNDSRDVFITYLVVVSFCYLLCSAFVIAHKSLIAETVRTTMGNNLNKVGTWLKKTEKCASKKHHKEKDRKLREDTIQRELSALREQVTQMRQVQQKATELSVRQWSDAQELAMLANVEPRSRDSMGRTPLAVAAQQGREWAVIAWLGKSYAEIDLPDIKRRTPLALAAMNGHEAVVFILLREGADVRIVDDNNETAEHLAERHGYTSIAAMIRSGVDIGRGPGPQP